MFESNKHYGKIKQDKVCNLKQGDQGRALVEKVNTSKDFRR